jgi:hypothetical protein
MYMAYTNDLCKSPLWPMEGMHTAAKLYQSRYVAMSMQVPVLRQALEGKDWQLIAQQQKARQFCDLAQQAAAVSLSSLSQTFDFLCELQPEGKRRPGQVHPTQQQQQQQDLCGIPLLVDCSRKVGVQFGNGCCHMAAFEELQIIMLCHCSPCKQMNMVRGEMQVMRARELNMQVYHGLAYRLECEGWAASLQYHLVAPHLRLACTFEA